MVGINSINSVPNWLLILEEEKFFTRCLIHDSVKKNEKNIFCLDCCTSICPHCSPLHRTHILLQPYTTNRAKVVFLKQRPISRSLKGSGNLCITCDRSLQDPYIFCSLSCKVHHLLLINKSASIKDSRNKYEFSVPLDKEKSSENPHEFEDSQITPDSVLDSHMSGSTSPISWGMTESLKRHTNCAASVTAELLKKKRGSVHMVPRIWCSPPTEQATAVNRRKGVPHRSPLY